MADASAATESRDAALSMSLDDMITANKKEVKKARTPAPPRPAPAAKAAGGAGGAAKGGAAKADRAARVAAAAPIASRRVLVREERSADAPGAWRHDKFEAKVERRGHDAAAHVAGAAADKPAIVLSSRVLVTNLGPELTSEDIQEVFGSVGDIKSLTMNLGGAGTGRSVEITYANRNAASKAVTEFDGRQVNTTRVRVRVLGAGGSVAASSAPAAHAPTVMAVHRSVSPFSGPKSHAAVSILPAELTAHGRTIPGGALHERSRDAGNGSRDRARGARGGREGGREGGARERRAGPRSAASSDPDADLKAYFDAARAE